MDEVQWLSLGVGQCVCVDERFGRLGCHVGAETMGEALVDHSSPLVDVPEREPIDVLHDEIGQAVVDVTVVDADDVVVDQQRRDVDLIDESLDAIAPVGVFGAKHFDRDERSGVSTLAGEIDLTTAAESDALEQDVSGELPDPLSVCPHELSISHLLG